MPYNLIHKVKSVRERLPGIPGALSNLSSKIDAHFSWKMEQLYPWRGKGRGWDTLAPVFSLLDLSESESCSMKQESILSGCSWNHCSSAGRSAIRGSITFQLTLNNQLGPCRTKQVADNRDQLGLVAGPWQLVIEALLGHYSASQNNVTVYLIEMGRPHLSHVARRDRIREK